LAYANTLPDIVHLRYSTFEKDEQRKVKDFIAGREAGVKGPEFIIFFL
jgi:hypothetical protein